MEGRRQAGREDLLGVAVVGRVQTAWHDIHNAAAQHLGEEGVELAWQVRQRDRDREGVCVWEWGGCFTRRAGEQINLC
jgi:hypothetical protein